MKRTKEKEAIMKVLQIYGLKEANLTSEFTREVIANSILQEQQEIWNDALSEMGIELK
jgi:hypothetical protein